VKVHNQNPLIEPERALFLFVSKGFIKFKIILYVKSGEVANFVKIVYTTNGKQGRRRVRYA